MEYRKLKVQSSRSDATSFVAAKRSVAAYLVPGLYHYLILAAILFSIGAYGALTRRNAISILMCIELMLNATNINLVAFSRFIFSPDGPLGQVFVVFIITVAAAEAAVALAIILSIYKMRKTVQLDNMNLMKW